MPLYMYSTLVVDGAGGEAGVGDGAGGGGGVDARGGAGYCE